RRDSKLSHIMDSIRHSLAHEHEKLPGESEAQHQGSVAVNSESGNNGSISPSLQAVASSKLNENNMGEHSHELGDTWGWPGLGTYASNESPRTSTSRQESTPPRRESVPTRKESEPSRRESTTSQASKKSHDTQTGWPGLGPFPEDV
ncbi:uncharacterized protein A1O5_05248, partial [Cladophialophora psammophila CBS 110553]